MKKKIAILSLAVRIATYVYVFIVALPCGDYYVRTRDSAVLIPNMAVTITLLVANLLTLAIYSRFVDKWIDPADWLKHDE